MYGTKGTLKSICTATSGFNDSLFIINLNGPLFLQKQLLKCSLDFSWHGVSFDWVQKMIIK